MIQEQYLELGDLFHGCGGWDIKFDGVPLVRAAVRIADGLGFEDFGGEVHFLGVRTSENHREGGK